VEFMQQIAKSYKINSTNNLPYRNLKTLCVNTFYDYIAVSRRSIEYVKPQLLVAFFISCETSYLNLKCQVTCLTNETVLKVK